MTALVDGGAVNTFPALYKENTGLNGVNILVCTHNDADHVGGLIGYLQSRLKCCEVWLPALWGGRLVDLLREPFRFIEELIDNICNLRRTQVESFTLSLENLGNQLAEDLRKELETTHRERADKYDMETLAGAIEVSEDYYLCDGWFPGSLWHGKKSSYLCPFIFEKVLGARSSKEKMLAQAIVAADRISKIVRLAYYAGAKIRWFEWGSKPASGGVPDFLIPVNAREIQAVQRQRWTALEFLALTIANKESLVFYFPPGNGGNSVLFTADSDLGFCHDIKWDDGMIITAPHHGAETNSYAYERFARENCNTDLQPFWVRSDGRFKRNPGNSFLQVRGIRYCTICRNNLGNYCAKQCVCFSADGGRWWPAGCVRQCSCSPVP